MTPIQVPLQAGSVQQTLNRLRLVVAALLLGVVSFSAVAVFLVEKGSMETNAALVTPLLAALAFLVVAAIAASSLLRRATLRRPRSTKRPPFAPERWPRPRPR